jgi:hypothetical protein
MRDTNIMQMAFQAYADTKKVDVKKHKFYWKVRSLLQVYTL